MKRYSKKFNIEIQCRKCLQYDCEIKNSSIDIAIIILCKQCGEREYFK